MGPLTERTLNTVVCRVSDARANGRLTPAAAVLVKPPLAIFSKPVPKRYDRVRAEVFVTHLTSGGFEERVKGD